MSPVIFIIPGFYEGPTVFKPLADALATRGFRTVTSSIRSTEQAGDDGVIAVMHSAAGFIGSAALKDLTRKARDANGKPGGVRKIIFVTAGVQPEGFELSQLPFFDINEANGTQSCKDPKSLLFSDLPDEQVDKWLPGLQHQPFTGYSTKLQYCGWRDVPSVYIICEGDKLLPVSFQESGAKLAGSEIVRLDGGHMVQLSQTEKLADIISSSTT
ncbi:hypothetical protein HG530_010689 [Fusarium avenaceum]|nr:hypothetical protein HG530_010689 [Fusarium avenaceum]